MAVNIVTYIVPPTHNLTNYFKKLDEGRSYSSVYCQCESLWSFLMKSGYRKRLLYESLFCKSLYYNKLNKITFLKNKAEKFNIKEFIR